MDAAYELSNRGNDSFPFEYYYLDPDHPRYVMPYHWHMDQELVRVISGRLTLYVGNVRLDLHEGDCVLVPPGAIHGSMPPAGLYECVVFDASKLFPESSPNLKAVRSFWDRRSESPLVIENGCDGSREAELFFAAAKATDSTVTSRLMQATGALLSILGRFYDAVSHLPSSHKEKTDRIKKVIVYIRQHYASSVTLEDLSLAAGLNKEYLCREFKAAIGLSPIKFLIEYRIERSKKILLAPDGSVTEAALSSGFSDISYYIKKFTSLNGSTPLQYRRMRVE